MALMGANDPDDAVQRITAAMGNVKKLSDVFAIIIYFGLRERPYNSFYANVAIQLCQTPGKIGKHSFRNLRQAIAAQLGSMLEVNSRCQLHLAQFFWNNGR